MASGGPQRIKHCLTDYKTEKRIKIVFNQTWYEILVKTQNISNKTRFK